MIRGDINGVSKGIIKSREHMESLIPLLEGLYTTADHDEREKILNALEEACTLALLLAADLDKFLSLLFQVVDANPAPDDASKLRSSL